MKAIECPHWSYAGQHGGNCAIGKFNKPSHGACTKLCTGKLIEINTPAPSPVAIPATIGGPGTELAKLLKSLGIGSMDNCSCKRHAEQMDRLGVEWCKANINTIEGWLIAEGKRRGWLFGVAARLSASRLITRAIEATGPDSIHVHSSSLGMGDSICALYAACGLAEATGKPLVYHSRHPQWLARVSHPNLTITSHNARGIDIGGGFRAYAEQIRSAESRVKKYCEDLAKAFGTPNFSGKRPAQIDSTSTTIITEKYVLLAPFSCHAVREWPRPKWLELATRLTAAGLKVVAIGGAGDQKKIKDTSTWGGIAWHWGQSPEWVCNAVAGAACVVANDSGPAHLGGLLGVPTVAVHAGTLPHEFLFDMAPSVRSAVADGAKHRTDHSLDLLSEIPSERVYETITACLNSPARGASANSPD